MTFWMFAILGVAVIWPAVLFWALQKEVNAGFEHFNRKILATGVDADMQLLRVRRRLAAIERLAGQEPKDFDAFRDQILKIASERRDAYIYAPRANLKTGSLSAFEHDFLQASYKMNCRTGGRFPYAIF